MMKFLERCQPYFILSFCFIIGNIIIRGFDFYYTAPYFGVTPDLAIFLRCIFNDVIWCGGVFLVLLPLYYIINLFSRRISVIVLSIIYGFLFFFIISIVIFTIYSGKLLDKEIFIRPFSEVIATVKSYGNIYLSAFIFIILIYIISFLSILLVNKIKSRFKWFFVSVAILLTISVVFINSVFRLYDENSQFDKFIANKAIYFIYDGINYTVNNSPMDYSDLTFLSDFRSEYPQWERYDSLYPFYRKDNIPDVLSGFFNLGPKKPNIVYIVVESLGRGVCGKNAFTGNFTPFLDSLINYSLYWENCLTTTERSFGILPSLLGSLPNGNRGFQFGDMPEHNSIVQLLNDNEYKTNMFYSGYHEFDCINDFMYKQGIGYFAPYYDEFKKENAPENKGSEWGYHDNIMFTKSLEDLESIKDENFFNIYVTVSTHSKLEVPEKEKYIQIAHSINKKLSQAQKKMNSPQIEFLAAFVYVDDALRQLFNGYKKRQDFKNTIFVITGDHFLASYGMTNPLTFYHVPLIIYSPLLKRSQHFKSVVTTIDVTPSIWSMLCKNYELSKPQFVHWISDGLDTTHNFHCDRKVLLMRANRDISEFIYNDNLYSYGSVFKITDGFKFIPNRINKYKITSKYNLFKKIHSYTYNSRRLMIDPFQVIERFYEKAEKKYKYPDKYLDCMERKITDLNHLYSKVRITANFDLCFDSIDLKQRPYLIFESKKDKKKTFYSAIEPDKLIMNEEQLQVNKWYNIKVSREYNTEDAKELEYIIYFYSEIPGKYKYKIKNQVYTLEGFRNSYNLIEKTDSAEEKIYLYQSEFFNCMERRRTLLSRSYSSIVITADFEFKFDSVDLNKNPEIIFECKTEIPKSNFYISEELNKFFINGEHPVQDKWYNVKISRKVDVHRTKEVEYIVYLYNNLKQGNYKYRYKNMTITLEGAP
jgi:lipoteichoic acid synthase